MVRRKHLVQSKRCAISRTIHHSQQCAIKIAIGHPDREPKSVAVQRTNSCSIRSTDADSDEWTKS